MVQLLRVTIEAVSLDSTSIKDHPDGTGALNEGGRKASGGAAAGSTPRIVWLPPAASRSSASAWVQA